MIILVFSLATLWCDVRARELARERRAVVWFRNREAGLMVLGRDDRGE